MTGFQMLLLQVIAIFVAPAVCYHPVYGTKRYGRSAMQRLSWPPYQMVRPQRHPIKYYELYPYSQEDYYPQETYPVYYPRTSKYEVYQAVLPYYYEDRYLRPYYDQHYEDEILQEAEREEREDSQPIGHEMLYENDERIEDENIDDVNSAFLENLIRSQMYQKDYDDYYGAWDDQQKPRYSQEDEDVRELKQLVKSDKNPKTDDVHWFQKSNFRNQLGNSKRSDRKEVVKSTSSPAVANRDARGQKEEVLMRPATPVKHPFTSPVLEMMSKNDERKRTPSVYDTIKHMLDMEKSLEKKYGKAIKPAMKKRIVSSEESLTHQLSVLKKAQ